MFPRLNQLLRLGVVAIATAAAGARADVAPAPAQPPAAETTPKAAPREPVRPPGFAESLIVGPGRSEPVPDELRNVTIDEHLGGLLPMDAGFTDENGQVVRLGDYFASGKPVILQMGYYGCPMLCDLVSQGTVNALRGVPLDVGKDFQVVFVSIDPSEGRELAFQKKANYVRQYGRGSADGWHFLIGREAQINRLARAVGFNYKWVPTVGQFSHPAAIVMCTPQGKVSRYLYGVRFEPEVLKGAIADAGQLKVVETVERFVMTCLQYDGKQGKHAGAAMVMMRVGGIVTVIVLASTLWILFSRERNKLRRERAAQGGGGGGFPLAPGT